jgi:hypothetical protein
LNRFSENISGILSFFIFLPYSFTCEIFTYKTHGIIPPEREDFLTNLRMLSDTDLITSLKKEVLEERKKMMSVLEHLREVDRRKLYAEHECDSLWAFCIKELKYSNGSAGRRVRAMRLIREIPTLKEDLLEGKQNLTSLSQAQSFFQIEEKAQEKRMTTEQKKEVLEKIEDKPTRDCEKELLKLSSAPIQISHPEKKREIDETYTELKLVLNAAAMRKLARIKALRSHANPSMNYAELFEYMADEVLKKIDPMEKTSKPSSAQNEAVQQMATTLARSKLVVWKRDQGTCSFKDPETGKCCGSTYFLELDHIVPVALGGSNEPSNLRLRCRGHNQRYAVKIYGVKKMESYQMK